jgi:hypothetical protein
MKLNTKYVMLACILLLILLISVSWGSIIIPYSATTRSYAIFEGMETKVEFNDSVNKLLDELMKMKENDGIDIKKKIIEIRKPKNIDYNQETLKGSLKGLSNVESSKTYKLVDKFITEKMPEINDEISKNDEDEEEEEEDEDKEGFENMSNSIDMFSSAVGSLKCVKTASGLSNSMGPLCLSDSQMYLLQSRGGNSTGCDSQIGM